MNDDSRIVLPPDKYTQKVLRDKLEEYESRLNRRKRELFTHSESFIRANLHAIYKHAILERLLKEGEIDTFSFSLELQRLHGFFDILNYADAVAVINDYCTTGGRNVRGGTGLIKSFN